MTQRNRAVRHALAIIVCLLPGSMALGQTAYTIEELLPTTPGVASYQIDIHWNRSPAAVADSLEAGADAFTMISGGLSPLYTSIRVPSAQIKAVSWEVLVWEDIEMSDPSVIPDLGTSVARVENVGPERHGYGASLTMSLVERTPRGARRVVSALLTITPEVVQEKGGRQPFEHVAVQNSVLSSGTFVKVPVSNGGWFRLDREGLQALGFTPGQSDPARVTVYSNHHRALPASNDQPRLADLVAIPTMVTGGGDGRFDASDAVDVYIGGPQQWYWDAAAADFAHETHPYSNEGYVFVTVAQTAAPTMQTQQADRDPAVVSALAEALFVHEIDAYMWTREFGSGQTWVSVPFRSTGEFALSDRLALTAVPTGTPLRVQARVATSTNPVGTIVFTTQGSRVFAAQAIRSASTSSESPTAYPQVVDFTWQNPTADLRVRLEGGGPAGQIALDWVRTFHARSFRAPWEGLYGMRPSGGVGATVELPPAPAVLFDVTDPLQPIQISSATGSATLMRDATDGRIFSVYDPSSIERFPTEGARPVGNQNLHADRTDVDLVIVAPDVFMSAASRLAAHRSSHDGLRVRVVRIDEIYNEFSGGMPDMRAIRDYFRFVYEVSPSFAYALLFGDGHHNFRSLGPDEVSLSNWIFPYETVESFDPEESYTSDDYFGFLDPGEGEWPYLGYRTASSDRIDIGIGRLPVQRVAEAEAMVDKLVAYDVGDTFGPWRSRYVFVADDGPTGLRGQQNDADLHVQNADVVATMVQEQLEPRLHIDKIYAEVYPRVYETTYQIPAAREAINAAIENGALLVNYSGHGGPDGLAQEDIFTIEDASALGNQHRLPVFITATCSFGWWDQQGAQSGAEALILNPTGGAIAMLTTVRLVYTSRDTTSLNVGLNRALNTALFRRVDQGARRLGDALRETKNTAVGRQGNSRKFNLLGDPSMRLGLATRNVVLTQLGEEVGTTDSLQLAALEEIGLKGEVHDALGRRDDGFSGTAFVEVRDAVRRVPLVEQRNMTQPFFVTRPDVIWRGALPVSAGSFEGRFIVPKDISYAYEKGWVSVYARAEDDHALGSFDDFVVGGTARNPVVDTEGPTIQAYLNDPSFVDGGLVSGVPTLQVELYDASGVNTVGTGVGHELLLVIDGKETEAVDVSGRYEADEEDARKGTLTYDLAGLTPGPHQVEIRAWDIANNVTKSTLSFELTEQEHLVLGYAAPFPNPTAGPTRFVVEHNQPPSATVEGRLMIYTIAGTPIRRISFAQGGSAAVPMTNPISISWDGLDETGGILSTGTYIFRLSMSASQDGGQISRADRTGAVVVIR